MTRPATEDDEVLAIAARIGRGRTVGLVEPDLLEPPDDVDVENLPPDPHADLLTPVDEPPADERTHVRSPGLVALDGAGKQWSTVDIATLGDADEHADAPRWAIERYLELGSRLEIVADEGIGKSLLVAQWSVCLAAGRPTVPFGDAVEPLRVLVIDTELNVRTARRRLRRMAERAGLRPGQLLYVLAPAGIDLLRDDDRGALLDIIAQFRPHVVAVDSLYRAFNGDPDDPRVGGQVQRVLDTIRASTGAALIIVCHYRKRATDGRQRRTLDDVAGSRVWKAWPETVVDLTRDRLRVLKDREGTAAELTIERRGAGEWEDDPDGWPFTLSVPETERAEWQGHTVIQRYALEVLARTDTPISTSRLADLIGEDRATQGRAKFHRGNVAAALGELLDHQPPLVTKQPGARGANDWTITPAGLESISTSTKEPAT